MGMTVAFEHGVAKETWVLMTVVHSGISRDIYCGNCILIIFLLVVDKQRYQGLDSHFGQTI
jgi:hypothetical protein